LAETRPHPEIPPPAPYRPASRNSTRVRYRFRKLSGTGAGPGRTRRCTVTQQYVWKLRSLRSDVSDEPRTYRNKHGSVGKMKTAEQGRGLTGSLARGDCQRSIVSFDWPFDNLWFLSENFR
jgi:hypothetical protein